MLMTCPTLATVMIVIMFMAVVICTVTIAVISFVTSVAVAPP